MIGGVNLSVASASVDVVLLSHVVKYLTDDLLVLCMNECRRVLRKSGRLIMWEFSPTDAPVVNHFIIKGAGGVRLRTRKEIQSVLSNSGFTSFNYFDIITPWTFWSNLGIAASFD
jgi:SAM-dependent methyltransferase